MLDFFPSLVQEDLDLPLNLLFSITNFSLEKDYSCHNIEDKNAFNISCLKDMPKDVISRLEKYFQGKKVILAFSGGLDSTVLLEIALQSASKVLPVIVKSTLQPAAEIKHALEY
ncbi:MAG: hypothetical protein ACXAAM_06520, partial [Candidatus Heimdallarchaeaceae archaeon]